MNYYHSSSSSAHWFRSMYNTNIHVSLQMDYYSLFSLSVNLFVMKVETVNNMWLRCQHISQVHHPHMGFDSVLHSIKDMSLLYYWNKWFVFFGILFLSVLCRKSFNNPSFFPVLFYFSFNFIFYFLFIFYVSSSIKKINTIQVIRFPLN